jgi:hypothetical protein
VQRRGKIDAEPATIVVTAHDLVHLRSNVVAPAKSGNIRLVRVERSKVAIRASGLLPASLRLST